ncbi:MAG: triphosphoribosyl-dephospho-CoA synthase MdcB [Rhodoferax sp.]|uniref:triphosphoribosyl-dephospho-CoA synthase MdcB n=1 Tax=Rhodoferax sp. TaxID=50421 RepID=UPI000ACA99C1|nr:triphosphoribosyl-dephospho-CoA synthase MdcB [Rhodoferax sp.]MDP2680062.1 triphosphoribosyl-dephospho-CoA synthase MdcB [Rhodoferax sp.]
MPEAWQGGPAHGMQDLRRNQLVCLNAQGWSQVQAYAWDAEAQAILVYWQRNKLPLVVCRQRLDVAPDRLCLGLPAPRQWSRRRLALTVGRDHVAVIGDFPTLRQVAQAMPWGSAALALEGKLTPLAVTPRVYGSHGWQFITKKPYLHDASDIDVSVNVPDFQTACRVTALLAASELGQRLDGEIVFPGGQAVAWRELQRLLAGHTAQVLLKDRHNVRLATLTELQKLGKCADWLLPSCRVDFSRLGRPKSALQGPWRAEARPTGAMVARSPDDAQRNPGGLQMPADQAPNHGSNAVYGLGLAAVRALYAEVALEPKPGLVSFRDCGSHSDMNAQTFMRSLFALRGYFPRMVWAGHAGAPFAVLESLGKNAEARMLTATRGINTHRGAIFGLGLLCASAGQLLAQGVLFTPQHVRAMLMATWGDALAQRARAARLTAPVSNGQMAARRFGLRSAGDEAAQAFPVLFEVTLPALQAALQAGTGERAARVQALFATMAALDDTNCAHRGGIDGLRWVQTSAREFLNAGGVLQTSWLPQAREIHNAFVARNLSPGGSADVLASACWVQSVLVGTGGADFSPPWSTEVDPTRPWSVGRTCTRHGRLKLTLQSQIPAGFMQALPEPDA